PGAPGVVVVAHRLLFLLREARRWQLARPLRRAAVTVDHFVTIGTLVIGPANRQTFARSAKFSKITPFPPPVLARCQAKPPAVCWQNCRVAIAIAPVRSD